MKQVLYQVRVSKMFSIGSFGYPWCFRELLEIEKLCNEWTTFHWIIARTKAIKSLFVRKVETKLSRYFTIIA